MPLAGIDWKKVLIIGIYTYSHPARPTSVYSFSAISTFGLPSGMRASNLTSDSADPMTFYIDLQWTPRARQRGSHAICFAAYDRKDSKE